MKSAINLLGLLQLMMIMFAMAGIPPVANLSWWLILGPTWMPIAAILSIVGGIIAVVMIFGQK